MQRLFRIVSDLNFSSCALNRSAISMKFYRQRHHPMPHRPMFSNFRYLFAFPSYDVLKPKLRKNNVFNVNIQSLCLYSCRYILETWYIYARTDDKSAALFKISLSFRVSEISAILCYGKSLPFILNGG